MVAITADLRHPRSMAISKSRRGRRNGCKRRLLGRTFVHTASTVVTTMLLGTSSHPRGAIR
jgi:hypothetical protein